MIYSLHYFNGKKCFLSATLLLLLFAACNSSEGSAQKEPSGKSSKENPQAKATEGGWIGRFNDGMKGSKLSFDVDGSEFKNLTFEGYWHCDGKLDLTAIGPNKLFNKGSEVEGVIQQDGFQFEIRGTFDGGKFDFSAGSYTTNKLQWTAKKG